MLKNIFLICMVAISTITNAQTWQDTVILIDKMLDRFPASNPGVQIAVSRNGNIIYSSVKGMADLEHNIPLTKQSKIEAGSVSKQFTAAAILLLEQQGKLSLNDDVRKYVTEVPDYGNTITLRHLLNHTSGIKDWGSVASLTGWGRGTKVYSNEDALHIISQQKTLNNKPGDEFIYSNSNYNLQAIIVQRVSGMSLADFSKKYIFEPAGMKNTEWRDNYRKVVPDRAIAYSKSGNNYLTNMPNENVYGNGGLLTTAEDLLTWNNYYLSGKLGSPALLPKQIALTPLNNGRKNIYAAGLFIDSTFGWAAIYHDGATAGYRSILEHYPQLGLSIALLSNTSQPDVGSLPPALRNLLVKNLNRSAPLPTPALPIDVKIFSPYLGVYRDARSGNAIKIFRNDTALFADQNVRLMPVADNAAMLGRNRLEFNNGKPRMLHFITASRDTLFYAAVDSANVTEKNIRDFEGTYYSDETESKIKAEAKDGKLFILIKGDQIPLTPAYKDGFSFFAGDINFKRDKKGLVNRVFVSQGRARNVEFKKL